MTLLLEGYYMSCETELMCKIDGKWTLLYKLETLTLFTFSCV